MPDTKNRSKRLRPRFTTLRQGQVALFLAAVMMLTAGRSDAATNDAVTSGGTNTLPHQAQTAALRGVDWIVANKDRMSLSFALKTFEKIHRVTASEPLRSRLGDLIQEKCAALPQIAPEINLNKPEKLNWYELRPIIMDLIYLKSLGKPWQSEAEKLKRLFTEKGDAILPAQVNLSERLVAAYKLQILGVPTGEIYSNTLAAIRSQGLVGHAPGQIPDKAILYARTHVIFTASGYYARYLTPAEFGSELDCFNQALAHFATWKEMNEDWADIAAEVLIAYKVLRQPPTINSEALTRRLITLQNPDGSWGSPTFSNTKVHHTYVALIALIQFADEFRINIDYL